jgi:hypothetical protein
MGLESRGFDRARVESIGDPRRKWRKACVVTNLGDLSNFTAEDWEALARRMGEPDSATALERRVLEGGRQGRPPKWTIRDRLRPAADSATIRLSETGWREPVPLGDVYAALMMWRRLGLVEPMPEWPMVRWWRRTALPQLLGIPLAAIHDDRLYACLDLALPHKQAIEEKIAALGRDWFSQSYRYLLHDLTSTYFEGQMKSNPQARRGYSRDHRPDCKQILIGAVRVEVQEVGE